MPVMSEPQRPQLGDRYRALVLIGRGGFGEVWRVQDLRLGRTVALKILHAEVARSAGRVQRFLEEAYLTAALQHPGVVAVHELEYLPGGQIGLIMQEVRGQTLQQLLDDGDVPLRRLVRHLRRVCQTVARAHAQGIVHRDIKPANVMIDEEADGVLLIDWGIAGEVDQALRREGTPAFTPPEQARGEPATARNDLFALGVTLRRILAHAAPDAALTADAVSPLARLAAHATRADPDERLESAQRFAEHLGDWLLHADRRRQAVALVDRADALREERRRLRQQHADALQQADALRARLGFLADIPDKAPLWDLEDRIEDLERRDMVLEQDYLQHVQSALEHDDTLAAAHDRLADYHHEQHRLAEADRDTTRAAFHEARLRQHDLGRHRSYLSGTGRLSLSTHPSGGRVTLYRLVEQGRRLVPVLQRELGPAPLAAVTLPIGSYLLEINKPAHHTAQYPVLIERDASWSCALPGDDWPRPVPLIPAGGLDEASEVYIPEGWFIAGGAEHGRTGFDEQRCWADGFIMRRQPVTVEEYAAFLRTCSPEEVPPVLPQQGLRWEEGALVVEPGAARLPVVGLDWHQAQRYAAWLAEETGLPWRLPVELEWEKAARGVDGRKYPWGRHFEPSWCRNTYSQPGQSRLGSVDDHPEDVSVYGVRGLAGNVKVWCLNPLESGGTEAGRVRVVLGEDARDLVAVRGGSWEGLFTYCQCASRFWAQPQSRAPSIGVHLVRSWGPT